MADSKPQVYVYVLLRTDLTQAQSIVQAAHAVQEGAYHFGGHNADDTYLVVCGVESELALLEAKARLERKGIRSYLYHEPDDNVGHSALATEPLRRNSQRKIMYPYPLWKPCWVLDAATRASEGGSTPSPGAIHAAVAQC